MDEVRHVALGPLREILVIALGHLAERPLVERLGHDEKAQPIAEIEELRGGRIVRRADGVCAHRLERLQPALPDPERHRGTNCAAVMMQIDASELYAATVEQESPILIERNSANAECRSHGIGNAVSFQNERTEYVEIRRVDRPQFRRAKLSPLFYLELLAGGKRKRGILASNFSAAWIEDYRAQYSAALSTVVVFESGADHDARVGRIRGGCGDGQSPVTDVQ